jgi:hypothetical protein
MTISSKFNPNPSDIELHILDQCHDGGDLLLRRTTPPAGPVQTRPAKTYSSRRSPAASEPS